MDRSETARRWIIASEEKGQARPAVTKGPAPDRLPTSCRLFDAQGLPPRTLPHKIGMPLMSVLGRKLPLEDGRLTAKRALMELKRAHRLTLNRKQPTVVLTAALGG